MQQSHSGGNLPEAAGVEGWLGPSLSSPGEDGTQAAGTGGLGLSPGTAAAQPHSIP